MFNATKLLNPVVPFVDYWYCTSGQSDADNHRV